MELKHCNAVAGDVEVERKWKGVRARKVLGSKLRSDKEASAAQDAGDGAPREMQSLECCAERHEARARKRRCAMCCRVDNRYLARACMLL